MIRTVRDGRVSIKGLWFRPDEHHTAYDGRLDGLRCAFGLYWGPPGYQGYRSSDGWQTQFVSLWGTEQAYRSIGECVMGPECVDGWFPWEWWHSRSQEEPPA